MKHPWQVWLSFAACVLAAIGGMAWLTREAVNADRSRRAAEAESELEQRVSLALWRIDTELAPIIAEEVIRPTSAYRPSTVAIAPPPYVLLQFEVWPKGNWKSPQSPLKRPELPLLEQLSKATTLQQLAPQLPKMPLPSVAVAAAPAARQIAQQQQMPAFIANAPPQFFEANRGANARSAVQQTDVPTDAIEGVPQVGKNSAAAKEADYQSRNRRYQSVAQQNFANSVQQQASSDDDPFGTPSPEDIETPDRVGVSRPLWVADRLLLARRVVSLGTEIVQGCWFDWPKLKERLLAETKDSLPNAELMPVSDKDETDPGRMLAGLPVRLVVNENVSAVSIGPALRWALWIGWAAVLLTVLAAAALLRGVMALSERRAAFVSSVTHELRTPLTTFRMYAEMLAKGMVPDAARRQEYFNTLQSEAERLTLLVENVLAYARLERGRRPQARDRVTVESLLDRVGPRLKQRAKQAGMECVVELKGEQADDRTSEKSGASRAVLRPGRGRGRPGSLGSLTLDEEFTTDQAVVEQILFNLVDNAAKYAREAADRRIHVEANRNGEFVSLTVRDHGPGMKNGFLSRPMQPFGKSAQESAESAPGVGLGLALCRRLARQLGGRLDVASAGSEGAEVTLLLPTG